MYHYCHKCPFGFIHIYANDNGITQIKIDDLPSDCTEFITDDIKKCIIQFDEYFEGIRKEFDLNLIIEGTEFQKKVWSALSKIPYGKTASYKDIAISIGNPNASRAVGNANNKNKFWIVIPCHRVIASDGALSGYAGKEWLKEALIKFEAENSKE